MARRGSGGGEEARVEVRDGSRVDRVLVMVVDVVDVDEERKEERKGGRKRWIGEDSEGRIGPPQAAQPIRGGIPPTTAPTQVLIILRLLR